MVDSLQGRNRFALITGFILLFCSAALAIWLTEQQSQAERWVRHTYDVEAALNQVQMQSMRTEIGRRGVILLGDVESRTTLANARRKLPGAFALVKHLTDDNDRQRTRLVTLQAIVEAKIATIDRSVALHDKGRDAEAIAIVGSDLRENTSRLVAVIAEIRVEEARLIARRMHKSEQYQIWARSTLVATFVLMIILALMVTYERRRQMHELRAANDQLNLLATNVTDAVFRTTLDGRILYASPSVREVTGYDPSVLAGQTVLRGIHRDDIDALRVAFADLANGSIKRTALTYRLRPAGVPDGWIWLEANSRLVRDERGDPVEVVSSIRDVSKRKALEFALDEARSKAEDAVRAKSSFLANMSHEIRTPMNGVLGFTDLLLAGELSTEQHHHAELIADSGRAMMRLLNDILDLSKVEAGQMKIAHEPFDLPHALKACLKLITPAVAQKGVALECEFDPDLPRLVKGDGLRLRQIVLNLLGNAAKFTEHGSVTLRALHGHDRNGSTVRIEVRDTGIGIAHDRQAGIFEQFAQADTDVAARFGGTGLGLSISVQLARLMGGEISLASESGIGSQFFLTLPITPVDERRSHNRELTKEDDVSAHVIEQRPLRVLVAEDHDVNQVLIAAMLKQLGCESAIANDGAEAVAMVQDAVARKAPYDIVLMDMQMPLMDGIDATTAIRVAGIDPAMLPILALTANAYAEDIASCLASGMQAHLAKPLLLADLKVALAHWAKLPEATPRASMPSPRIQELYRIRKAETLDRLAELIRVGRFEDVELAKAVDMLHKLAGSAGMFGEFDLGKQAQDLEHRLLAWNRDEIITNAASAVAALRAAA